MTTPAPTASNSQRVQLLQNLNNAMLPILCVILLVQMSDFYRFFNFPSPTRLLATVIFFVSVFVTLFAPKSWSIYLCAAAIVFFQGRYSEVRHHHFYLMAGLLAVMGNLKLIETRNFSAAARGQLSELSVFALRCLLSGIYFHSAMQKLTPHWQVQDQLLQLFLKFHAGSFFPVTPQVVSIFHTLTWIVVGLQLIFAAAVLFAKNRLFLVSLMIFHVILQFAVPVGSFSVLICLALIFLFGDRDLALANRILRGR